MFVKILKLLKFTFQNSGIAGDMPLSFLYFTIEGSISNHYGVQPLRCQEIQEMVRQLQNND